MNSYILTFKKKIFITFILIFVYVIIFNTILLSFVEMKTTNSTYINNKFSKIKHFNLNNETSKDIIFIGSSKTFYHISTNIFKKNNINIYNLGIPGGELEDYPFLVRKISNSGAKKIVISLSVNRLYDELSIPKVPVINDLVYYYSFNKDMFINVLKQYLISFHTFLQYSEPIYLKIKSIYEKFNIIQKEENDKNNVEFNKLYNYSDCSIFNIKKNSSNHMALKCTNGDGLLIGSLINLNLIKKDKIILNKINPNVVNYFNQIRTLISDNMEVILILEPILENNYVYNFNEIVERFPNIKIIDLTSLIISNDNWADLGHLNYSGRLLYSNYLISLYLNKQL